MNKEQNQTEELKDQVQQENVSQEQEQQAPKAFNLNDKEAVEAYINDPQIKEDHLKIARQLETVFDKRWFTVDMIADKTMMKDKGAIMQMMLGLQLFNLVNAAEGGINYKHQTKFKLTISPQDRLKVLEQYKESQLKQLELIDKEIEKVKQQIEDEATKEQNESK